MSSVLSAVKDSNHSEEVNKGEDIGFNHTPDQQQEDESVLRQGLDSPPKRNFIPSRHFFFYPLFFYFKLYFLNFLSAWKRGFLVKAPNS